MGLDIYLQPKVEPPRRGGDYEFVAQLEDDGYYVFLAPLLEDLKKRSGQFIDLYGFAFFGGEQLDDLKRILQSARQLIEGQPKSWNVWTGTQTYPVKKEIYRTVHKPEFEELLNKLERAVDKAQAESLYLTFWGD